MKNNISLVFFGSTTDSLEVLNPLLSFNHPEFNIKLEALITKPPSPVGREKTITPTPVEIWGQKNKTTVLSFASDINNPWQYNDTAAVEETLSTFKPDLLISASYGQIIPYKTIKDAKFGGINVHPSLLPRWRGADPLPWTILCNDHQSGVTIVTLSEKFDEGKILAQKKIPVNNIDTTIPLRQSLFNIGGKLLIEIMPELLKGNLEFKIQNIEQVTIARRLKREDGFIPWPLIIKAINGEDVENTQLPPFLLLLANKYNMPVNPWANTVERMLRALLPWPGIWSEININNETKRIKILNGKIQKLENKEKLIIEKVLIEGKSPIPFLQFRSSYNV